MVFIEWRRNVLVLSRKIDEQVVIWIPPSTKMRVVRLMVTDLVTFEGRATKCRLGFVADADIIIHRQEIADAIAADKRLNDGE